MYIYTLYMYTLCMYINWVCEPDTGEGPEGVVTHFHVFAGAIFFCIFFSSKNLMQYILSSKFEATRIKNSHFSRKLSWKNCWKLPKFLPCWQAHSFKTIKDIDPKPWYHKLKNWMKFVSKFHVPIFYTSREISRQIALPSGRAGSCRVGLVGPVHRFK